MAFIKTCLAVAALGLFSVTSAQCPNEVALYNQNVRSQTVNGTWFIVPVASSAVQAALDGIYGNGSVLLASVPTTDKTLFPQSFPNNAHPVLVNSGFSDDIRQAGLQIDGALLGGQVGVPYVRKPTSAPGTILYAQLSSYIAGEGNNALAGLVPALASTVYNGYPTRLGQFLPDDAAYQLNGGNVLSNNVAWDALPNPISGPGAYIEAQDMQYYAAAEFQKTTAKLFKAVLNQPAILAALSLSSGMCERNQYYFNNATGVMLPRIGNVTMGPAVDGTGPQPQSTLGAAAPGGYGFYSGLEGFSACAQQVGYNPENCDQASKNVDRSAL